MLSYLILGVALLVGVILLSGWFTRADPARTAVVLRWTLLVGGVVTAILLFTGRTQIGKVLRHAAAESKRKKVNALVFVGDAFEENIDKIGHAAGELGLLGVPCFVFHEGGDPITKKAFQQITRLSGGAYCQFNANSAQQLKDLLNAVAVYAAGGRVALADYSNRKGGEAARLEQQLLQIGHRPK